MSVNFPSNLNAGKPVNNSAKPINNSANRRLPSNIRPPSDLPPSLPSNLPPSDLPPVLPNDLPPSDLPPVLPSNLPPPIFPTNLPMPAVVKDTHVKGVDVILPPVDSLPQPPFTSLPVPIRSLPQPILNPSIIVSPPQEKKAEVKHSNNVNSSPVYPVVEKKSEVKHSNNVNSSPVVKKPNNVNSLPRPIGVRTQDDKMAARMKQLKDDADKTALDNIVYRADEKKVKNLIGSTKPKSDTVDDEDIAKQLEASYKNEVKTAKEQEDDENLALLIQMLEGEKQVQKPVNQQVQCCLSDECIQMLKDSKWTLDFDGQFGVDPSGDVYFFAELKNIYDI